VARKWGSCEGAGIASDAKNLGSPAIT
jgi:hypothetical protein